MTSSINCTDLKQKMLLLKELHAEMNKPDADWGSMDPTVPGLRNRYIQLRVEVSELLAPLFEDLNETGMMILWTKATANSLSQIDELEFNGLNSGLQMSIKEYDE